MLHPPCYSGAQLSPLCQRALHKSVAEGLCSQSQPHRLSYHLWLYTATPGPQLCRCFRPLRSSVYLFQALSSLPLSLYIYMYAQRLECSSFLAMRYFPPRDYHILPKKELHSSLWACIWMATSKVLYGYFKLLALLFFGAPDLGIWGLPVTAAPAAGTRPSVPANPGGWPAWASPYHGPMSTPKMPPLQLAVTYMEPGMAQMAPGMAPPKRGN